MKKYVKQYNALRVTVFGDLEPVYIEDFSASEGLGAAIGFGCERINAVSTRELQMHGSLLGISLVGFVDAHGYEKNYIPNRCMQELSGYSMLMGPGVLCGWKDNDYAPLDTRQVENMAHYFAGLLGLPEGKKETMAACFRVAGQSEYEQGLKLSNGRDYENAHALFEKSWALGYADGLNAVACDYLYGEGVPKDYEKGHQLMQQAADLGCAKAIRNIGAYSLSGNYGYPVDEEKAREYLQKAADMSDRQAQGWLGFMYSREGYGFKNTLKALYWAQKAMKKDDDIGWLTLSMVIAEDEYYPYQPRHVRYCLEKYMALCGCTLEEALVQLHEEDKNEDIRAALPLEPAYPEITWEMFEASDADPYDQYTEALGLLKAGKAQEGRELLQKAADQGCHYAMGSMGWRLMDGGQGNDFSYDSDGSVSNFPVDLNRAWSYQLPAARLGDTGILQILAFAYTDTDEALARELLNYYVELTDDSFVKDYVLPNLKMALALSDTGQVEHPSITGAELEALEQKFPACTRKRLSIPKRIRLLKNALAEAGEEDTESLMQLLEVYLWIAAVQE